MKAQLDADPGAASVGKFPLIVIEAFDFSKSKHVSDEGKLYADGSFLGTFRVKTTARLSGFTAGTILVGETADGKVSFVSDPMRIGVDGSFFDWVSASDRRELFRFVIPTDVAARTVKIEAIFFSAGKKRLKQILADVDEYYQTIIMSQAAKDAAAVGSKIGALTK